MFYPSALCNKFLKEKNLKEMVHETDSQLAYKH